MIHCSPKNAMNSILFCIILLSISQLSCSRRLRYKPCQRTTYDHLTTNYRSWREQRTVCELLDNYDPSVRPSGRSPNSDQKGPVIVFTSMKIRSISAVSERNMEFVAQFRFQQEWYDDRLRFAGYGGFTESDFINVARDQVLWTPDTFFQNERNGWYHMLDQENKYVKVRSDGKIFYNRRLTLILACNMNLIRYPMDIQECLIDFASYAYTTSDIIYKWNGNGISIDEGASGALPNFEITAYKNSTCDSITNTGAYSCLRVKLKLSRVFSFFLLQLYIPSAMLVGVSWVSYWIDWKSTAARVPLAIVTLLTMITQSHAINSNLPPVSYTKAIDIWIGACVVFIFASLIEYAVVNYMGILEEHKQMKKISSNRTRLSKMLINEAYYDTAEQTVISDDSTWNPRMRGLRRRKPSFELREQEEQHELINFSSRPTLRVSEQDWTFQDTSELVYMGQKRRVEILKWLNVLSNKGRAERIDIIARLIFPIAFVLFNFTYWSVYLGDAET